MCPLREPLALEAGKGFGRLPVTAISTTGAISAAGPEQARAFLRVLADRLDVAVTTGEATGLTMVASPRALGMIRSDYSVAIRKALRGELDKDLVKMPVHEIEKHLLA